MALPKAHHIETLSEFNSLKFSYDSTNTHYFTGGTSTIVEGTPDILYTDIAYIKPLSAIYTHAKLYPCPVLEYDNEPIANSGNLMTSGNIKSALDNNQRVFYSVTETAGATAVKEFTISDFPTETINGVKTPLKGIILIAQCANADARTAQLKFKVNDGGKFPIWYNNAEYVGTTAHGDFFGTTTRVYTYIFSGTHWCWISNGVDNNTTYTAGTGLKLSGNQFSLNVPRARVGKSANSVPDMNTAIFEEYNPSDNFDLPTNSYYHILTMAGNRLDEATQLALCMSESSVYYRNLYNNVWQPWLRLNPTMDSTPTAGNTSNVVSSAGVKTAIDTAPRFYLGTCSTAGNVAIKQVDIPNFPTQLVNGVETPIVGSVIAVKFSESDIHSESQGKIKVNNTSAYSVWYHQSESTSTSASTRYFGLQNRYTFYLFDGNYWVWINYGVDNDTTYTPPSLGFGYAACTTAAATAAKTASLSNYSLVNGGLVVVYFQYDVPAQATLNINSKGAKEIHFGSSRIAAGVIKAGDKCLFVYNGNYMLIAIDRWGKELQEKVSGINISETDFEELSAYEQGKLYFVYDDNNS